MFVLEMQPNLWSRVFRTADAISITGLLLLTLYLVATTSSWGLTTDAPIFHYIADRMMHGEIPYRDMFDMNMPIVYWIHFTVVRSIGGSDIAWRAVDLAALACICILIYTPVARFSRLSGILVVCVVSLFHFSGGETAVGERDFFLLVPLSAFALSFYRALDRSSSSTLEFLISGTLLGIATFIKPTCLVVFGLFSLYLVFAGRFNRDSIRDLLVFGSGLTIVAAIVLLHLSAIGALRDFLSIQINFVFNVYSQVRVPMPWGRLPRVLPFVLPISLALVGLMGNVDERIRRLALIFAMLATFGIVNFAAQGLHWPYHLYPAVVFGIAMAGAAHAALRTSSARQFRIIGSITCVLALVLTAAYFAVKKPELLKFTTWKRPPEVEALVSALKHLGDKGLVIQATDTSTLHSMYIARSRSATRFIYMLPLFLDDNSGYIASLRRDMLDGLRSAGHPPIILNETLSSRLSHFNPMLAHTAVSVWWPELADLLAKEYQIFNEIDIDLKEAGTITYAIYVHKAP